MRYFYLLLVTCEGKGGGGVRPVKVGGGPSSGTCYRYKWRVGGVFVTCEFRSVFRCYRYALIRVQIGHFCYKLLQKCVIKGLNIGGFSCYQKNITVTLEKINEDQQLEPTLQPGPTNRR